MNLPFHLGNLLESKQNAYGAMFYYFKKEKVCQEAFPPEIHY